MNKTCDVIIGGGGMVGLTLGLALARGGMTVAVADPLPKETVTGAAFDGRVSALAYAAVRMFRALGVWEHLESDAQPIEFRERADHDALRLHRRLLAVPRTSRGGQRRAVPRSIPDARPARGSHPQTG